MGKKNPVYTNGTELSQALKKIGFTVTKTGGGHFKATHPDHQDKPAVRFAATPSDYRWSYNILSWIKRTYGMTLTK